MNKILLENMIITNDSPDIINIDVSNNKLFINIQSTEYKHIIINIPCSQTASIYLLSNNTNSKTKIEYNLYKNSKLEVVNFSSDQNKEEEVIISLNEEYASINYNNSSITKNIDKNHIIVKHNSKNTTSNIICKSITLDNSTASFTIDSYVPKNSKNSIIKQATKIITMDKNNSIIKPNMYIDEKDISATHSSSIGTFDKESLFYLSTRGIDYTSGLKLLIKGFLIGNTDLDLNLKEIILNEINKYWRW